MIIYNDIEGQRRAINEKLITEVQEVQLQNGRFGICCHSIAREVFTIDFQHQDQRDYIFDLICGNQQYVN